MAHLIIDRSFILFVVLALGGTFLILYISNFLHNYNQCNWIAYIGENSLMVMCVHVPLNSVIMNCINVMDVNVFENHKYMYLNTLLFLILSVALSLLIGIGIKKIFPYCFMNK